VSKGSDREERQTLGRFGGFGPVALSIFPDPVTGRYKDASWQAIGDELKDVALPRGIRQRQTHHLQRFLHFPNRRCGHPRGHRPPRRSANAIVLEPGCGTGNFLAQAPAGMRFIGVELDGVSAGSPGCFTRPRHPPENFRDTRLPEGRIDAVIGNVPFADVKLRARGQKLLAARFLLRQVDRRSQNPTASWPW
jgi:hypothetical protein